MKYSKIAALALALAASRAQALVDINVFGGYATVGMGDLNDAINKSVASGGGAVTGQTMTSGYYAGAAAGFTMMPFLKIGPRLEFLQSGQGNVKSAGSTTTIDASLMSYELGLSADSSLPLTGLSLEGGIWGGYGVASSRFANSTGSKDGSGSGFVANVGAQLRYELVAGFALGLDLGYRMANITNMNATAATSSYGGNSAVGKPMFIKSGTVSDAANFDYSGLNAGATLAFNF